MLVSLGSAVTVLEARDRFLPNEDAELAMMRDRDAGDPMDAIVPVTRRARPTSVPVLQHRAAPYSRASLARRLLPHHVATPRAYILVVDPAARLRPAVRGHR